MHILEHDSAHENTTIRQTRRDCRCRHQYTNHVLNAWDDWGRQQQSHRRHVCRSCMICNTFSVPSTHILLVNIVWLLRPWIGFVCVTLSNFSGLTFWLCTQRSFTKWAVSHKNCVFSMLVLWLFFVGTTFFYDRMVDRQTARRAATTTALGLNVSKPDRYNYLRARPR